MLPHALQRTKTGIIGMVHDEIILETPSETALEVSKILTTVMEEALRCYLQQVPILAEAHIAETWADKTT